MVGDPMYPPRNARFSFVIDKRGGGDFCAALSAVFLRMGGSSLTGGRCRWGSVEERAKPEKEDDRAVEDERAEEDVVMVGRDDC